MRRARWRRVLPALAALLLLASLWPGAPAAAATSRTYSLDSDFDEGIMVGLNHDAPGSDQLQLNTTSSTFPFIWIANSGEGTISKLDTVTGAELGRYRTAPNGVGSNPSRTTVDLDGNVWVGNRNSNTVTKVGLKEAGNCIDRNGNGVIDTSTGGGDVRAWVTAPNPADECILLHVRFPSGQGNNVRMVAIDASNNVYAGSSADRWFHHIDGATGAILRSRQIPSGINYGGVVDPEGRLWVATLWSNRLHRYDPNTDTFMTVVLPHTSYGLGIDKFGNVWHSGYNYRNISKIRRSDGMILGTFPIPGGCDSRGVAVEDNGDVWVANTCSHSAGHLGNNGSNKGTVGVGYSPTGVAIDAAGKVWVTNLGSHNATRIDPATNATSTFAVGSSPYNYSDMTGHVVRNITTNIGTWSVIHDSGTSGTAWGTLSWNDTTPAGTNVTGRVRAADTIAGLGSQAYVGVGNGVGFTGVTGRYIQIEMKLQTATDGVTPVLFDVTIQPEAACGPTPTLSWKAPLSPSTVHTMSVNDPLHIRFGWHNCGSFIRDESVLILIQDPGTPDYPLTGWVYGSDIEIDAGAEEYRQDFYASWYGVAPGTTLEVEIYMNDEFLGEALVYFTP